MRVCVCVCMCMHCVRMHKLPPDKQYISIKITMVFSVLPEGYQMPLI